MTDNIFGNLILPENRLRLHKENLQGVQHTHRIEPLDPTPNLPIVFTLRTGGPVPCDRARMFYTLDDRDPSGPDARVLDLELNQSTWDEVTWSYIRQWSVELPPQPAQTLIRYHLAARVAGTERWIFADNQAEEIEEATDFAVWVEDDLAPAWAYEAQVYHVFVDRFNPGSQKAWNQTNNLTDFYGGTLRGVIEKLDYIQSFGFNTIWLSPFFKTTTYHGYNASDYLTVEPRFGVSADIKELIEKVHARGMRLVLDFVANHWSKDHPTFQDAQKNPESPYRDWYIWRKWPDDYEMYFSVRELPKINLKPGPARDHLLEIAKHWLREGVDGYRLDFAYGPPHDFWTDFRRACRSVKPDVWIFGEVVHSASVQRSFAGRMDGTLDFLLTRALRETFAFESMSLDEFESFLGGHENYFPPAFVRPSFLDNHDMSRFYYISAENKSRLKMASLVLYTLAGPPIIYNGTEAGVSQERPMQQGSRYLFEEARQPMKWDAEQDAELVDFFRRLGALRRAYPVLHSGSRLTLHLDSAKGTYAYARTDGRSTVLMALNMNPSPQTLTVHGSKLPQDARDRLNGNQVTVRDDSVMIELPGQGGAFIA
ncbi:MAG TPA: alpha-amylase family glycosyl hydrolase [Anaerolineales bacterium]|nr:alpha-amylase family glycosyl hydrolase [Anaerolineales bacterium]